MPILTLKQVHRIVEHHDSTDVSFEGIDPNFESALLYETQILKTTPGDDGFYPLLGLLMKAIDIITIQKTSWQVKNFNPGIVDIIKRTITSNQMRILTKLNISYDDGAFENYEWEPRTTGSQAMEVSEEKPEEADEAEISRLSGISEHDLLELEQIRQFSREVSFSVISPAAEDDEPLLGYEATDVCSPLAEPSLVRCRSLATTVRSNDSPDSELFLPGSPQRCTPSPQLSPLISPVRKKEAVALSQTVVDFKKTIASEEQKLNDYTQRRKSVFSYNVFSWAYAYRQMNRQTQYKKLSVSIPYNELEDYYYWRVDQNAKLIEPIDAAEAETKNYVSFLCDEHAAMEEKYLSVSCPHSFFYRLESKAAPVAPGLSTLPDFKL